MSLWVTKPRSSALSLLLTNLCHKFLSVVRLLSYSTMIRSKNIVEAFTGEKDSYMQFQPFPNNLCNEQTRCTPILSLKLWVRMLKLTYAIGIFIHLHTHDTNMLIVFSGQRNYVWLSFPFTWQYYNGNEYILLLKSAQMPWKIEKVSNIEKGIFLSKQTQFFPHSVFILTISPRFRNSWYGEECIKSNYTTLLNFPKLSGRSSFNIHSLGRKGDTHFF